MKGKLQAALDKFNAVPRVDITHQPTLLEKAPRLSEHLGCQLYFKRDDCTGLAGGGNKARKLEYIIAQAQLAGADTLVTLGGMQSNHARQTAAAAAKFGFECHLVLEDVAGSPKEDFFNNGNALLDNLLGATIHQIEIGCDIKERGQQLMDQLTKQGKKPFFVPIGGSSVHGSLGYVRCALELLAQLEQQNIELDQIVLATGSAGTQAGLLAGLILAGSDIAVLGVSVSRDQEEQEALVSALLEDILSFLGLPASLAKNRVIANGNYYKSYGVCTEQMLAAVRCCATKEGILLDPVYTGKGMAGLIDLIEKGEITRHSRQLFLHTGGSQGLFAYREVF